MILFLLMTLLLTLASAARARTRLQEFHVQAGNGSFDIWLVSASILKRFRP